MSKELFFYVLSLVVIYMVLYPKHHMISDEIYYAQQGVRFFQDEKASEVYVWKNHSFQNHDMDVRHYKIGVGLTAGGLMAAFGNRTQYLLGILSLAITIIASASTLQKLGYSPFWSSLFALSPVNGLLCRTVMSDLPSMALSALFVFLLIRNKRTIHENIAGAFILGISFFFRETNIVVIGILSLPFLLGKNSYKLLFTITSLVSWTLMAFVTAKIFNEPLFVRDLGGLGFSLDNVLANMHIYTLSLTIILPLGSIFIYTYKGKYAGLFKTTTIILLSFYLLYEYNGFNGSGAKGVLLNSRFLLPLFPLVAIATAYGMENWKYYKPNMLKLITGISIASFFIMNIAGYLQNEKQEEIISIIKQNNTRIYTSDTESNILKYANYFTGARLQIQFDKTKIKKALSSGETIAVIYSKPTRELEEWLDYPTQITIEEKANTIFMDKAPLRLILLEKKG